MNKASSNIPNSIQKKFLLISLSHAVILIFFFIVLLSLSIKNTLTLRHQYADNTIQKASSSLSSTCQNVLSVAYLLSHGPSWEHYLLPKNDYELYTQHQYLSSAVNSVITSNDAITDIVLFRSDGRLPYHYSSDNTTVNLISSTYRTDFEQQPQQASFRYLTVPSENISCLAYVQPVTYLSSQTSYWNKQLGCLVIFLNMDKLQNLLSFPEDHLLLNIQLLDSERNLLYSVTPGNPDAPQEYTDIEGTDLTLAYSLNPSPSLRTYSLFSILIPVVFLSFILLYAVLLFVYNRSIIIPVHELYCQICGIIENNLKGRIHLVNNGEISVIGKILNTLLDHQENLSQELLDTQKKFYESALKAKENELMILETQINPHFIINTLQCICGIAVFYDALPILDVSDHMGKILQYSLRAPDKVTLKEELDIIYHYLSIIDIRFDHLFHWELDVDEDFYDQLLPKMTLQPLIENAIYHGLEKKGSGAIIVSSYTEESQIILQIWDNGMGIEADKLKNLQELLNDQEALYKACFVRKRIGLANSALRIKNLLGPASGIQVSSDPDNGTTITIHLSRLTDSKKPQQT